jgi:hypothetical protein
MPFGLLVPRSIRRALGDIPEIFGGLEQVSKGNASSILGVSHLWDCLAVQAYDNAPKLFITMGEIKEHLVRNLGALCCLCSLGQIDEANGQNEENRNGEALQ